MGRDISWAFASVLSLISFTTSFFVFLFLQVIWGDILKDTLSEGYQAGLYFNINLILIIGLVFVFLISIFINLFIFRDFMLGSKLIASVFSLIFTLIILFFISWLMVVVLYPELYDELTIIEKLKLGMYFFAQKM